MGNSFLCLESLHTAYALAANKIRLTHDWQNEIFDHHIMPDFKVGNTVLLGNHISSVWDPKYDQNYFVVYFVSDHQVALSDLSVKLCCATIRDIKIMYAITSSTQLTSWLTWFAMHFMYTKFTHTYVNKATADSRVTPLTTKSHKLPTTQNSAIQVAHIYNPDLGICHWCTHNKLDYTQLHKGL